MSIDSEQLRGIVVSGEKNRRRKLERDERARGWFDIQNEV
jgi:hypothetical protein